LAPSAKLRESARERGPDSRARVWLLARGLLAVGLVGFFVWRSFDPHAADFKSFYSAGYAITHAGVPLYDLKELEENPFGEVFKLPPTAALYAAPLPLGTIQQARLVWRVMLVVAYIGALALLCRALGVRLLGPGWLLGLAAWAVFAPAQISVGEGQWDPLFLLTLAVAAVAVQRSRMALAGVAIALAASVKPYPALAALFFVGRRRWGSLAATLAALAGLLGLGALAAGAHETTVFLTRVLPASGVTTAYLDNQSLGGVLARLATTDLKPEPLVGVATVDVSIRLLAVALGAFATWSIWRAPSEDGFERAIQFSLLVPLSILVIPAAWTHYQTILLLPLFLLALDQARRRPTGWLGWALLGVAFILTALPNPAMIVGDELDRALWLRSRADGANLALQRQFPTAPSRLIISYKALGTLLVFGLVAWRVWRVAPAGSPSPEQRPTRSGAALAGARTEAVS
jgi:hypothetical protein